MGAWYNRERPNCTKMTGQPQLVLVLSDISSSAIRQIIVNGAALISSVQPIRSNYAVEHKQEKIYSPNLDPNPNPYNSNLEKLVTKADEDGGDY